jgi:HEAT repeat protein
MSNTRWTLWLVLLTLPVRGQDAAPAGDDVQEARRPEPEGSAQDDFLKYLETPGAEHLALRLARPKAAAYLEVLDQKARSVWTPRREALRGDLLLALNRKPEALAAYREAAVFLSRRDAQPGAAALSDAEAYLVEPPDPRQANRPIQPFTLGPGSHRDNWLLRRLIALEAWDEAATEFARVWSIHRRHASSTPAARDPGAAAETPRGRGFDGFGLQFALDYAFFLKRRNQIDNALTVLREPLLAVDLDRNPNETGSDVDLGAPGAGAPIRTRPRRWDVSGGVSRKEFIRLAYGVFKSAGRDADVDRALADQIGRGDNRARRVLARIRSMQGKLDEALALELEYIRQAKFDDLSAAFRRGTAHEEAQRLDEAAAEYEKVLSLPLTRPPHIPDPDEEETQRWMMSSAPLQILRSARDPATPQGQARFKSDVLERLRRLYGALGRGEKAADLALRQFELNPALQEQFELLDRTFRQLRAAGREAAFLDWARARAAASNNPLARATLHWLAGNPADAARALGEAARSGRFHDGGWKDRFRAAGPEPLRLLLQALVDANPKDAVSRLELLDLQDRFEGPAAIEALEILLDGDATPAFVRGKGARNRTRFRNYPDLALRLMRLYERQGNAASESKLAALGFRVLEGRKPFQREDHLLRRYRANWNQSYHDEGVVARDTLHALYVFLDHLKSPEEIQRAADLARRTGSLPLVNQVNRLLPEPRPARLDPSEAGRGRYRSVVVRTPGLPDGVKILTQRDDIRAVSPDGAWIGTSWGLARYRETKPGDTLEILQIPLGARVTSFCETPAGLFVGSWDGLYRIDGAGVDEPAIVRIDLAALKPAPRARGGRDAWRVDRLLAWKDRLWVEAGSAVFAYDPAKKTAQVHEAIEGPLFAARDRLWSSRAVYDDPAGEFDAIRHTAKEWRLIGGSSREIWADIYVDDALRHRPALFDPQARTFHVLPVANPPSGGSLCINSNITLVAERGDRVWLYGNGHLMIYDRAAPQGELRLISSWGQAAAGAPPPAPGAPIVPFADPNQNRAFHILHCGAGRLEALPGLSLEGDRGPYYVWRERPGGGVLLGAAVVREWWEDNLGHDDNDGMSHHVQDLEGGLFAIDRGPDGTLRWTKRGARDGELTDFYVKKIVADDAARRAYVCTNGGVSILSIPDGAVAGRITVSDGLPSNKVEDVVRIGDRLYLACELGDEGGGLAVQDLRTGLIQVMTIGDGLKTDKIKALRADGTKLHVLYGVLYGVRAYGTAMEDSVPAPGASREEVRTFRSSVLDTATGRLSDGGEILTLAPPQRPEQATPLPIVGGELICRLARPGIEILGGTHGLVLVPAGGPALPHRVSRAAESVTLVLSRRQALLADAQRRPAEFQSEEDLARALRDENPLYRAKALASRFVSANRAAVFPLLAGALEDAELRVRCTALFHAVQSKSPDEKLIPCLERRLNDADDYLRAVTAIELCRRGRVPDLRHLREILQRGDRYGNFPYGPDSSIGVRASREQLYPAVAPHATPDLFALLMESPPRMINYDFKSTVFPSLGEALCRHPEAAKILLAARDSQRYETSRRDFARDVFRCAGKEILPVLHQALKSLDRVVRSNAARGCGAIGEPSSIPLLLKALNLESGLSRASIVWALGALKAREALPALAALYVDAVNDERRRAGSGFRQAQSQAEMAVHYTSLSNLDALGTEWDELRAAAEPRGIDPRRDEELLEPRHVLEAVRAIGPAAAQDFYRALAGAKDPDARREAATALAECEPAERERNATVLKNLLADADELVRVRAAVSLLIMGDEAPARAPLLEALAVDPWKQGIALNELNRVKDAARLDFARPAIEALAARGANDELRRRAAQLLKRMPKSR